MSLGFASGDSAKILADDLLSTFELPLLGAGPLVIPSILSSYHADHGL